MTIGRFAKQVALSTLALINLAAFVPSLEAADDHDHAMTAAGPMTADQQNRANALVAAVRAATERFKNVAVAEAEGYALQFGCVSGGDLGAMGLHFVNGGLVDGELDPARPEIVLYEALPNGQLRLTGADFLVPVAAWNAAHPNAGPPELMGQLFHLFDAPNRFGLPAFYTLHVWAWKENPNGTFTNWNPNVSCDGFNAQD